MVPGALDTGGSNQRSIRFADRGRNDDNFTYDGIDAMLATAEGGGTGGPQLVSDECLKNLHVLHIRKLLDIEASAALGMSPELCEQLIKNRLSRFYGD